MEKSKNLDEYSRKHHSMNINVDELIYSIIEELSKFIEKKEIQVSISSKKGLVACLNEEKIRPIIRSLLMNTIDITSKSGFVGIYCYLEYSKLLFCVESLNSSPNSRKYDNAKIKIIKMLIKEMRGNIWISKSSIYNKRVFFYFEITKMDTSD